MMAGGGLLRPTRLIGGRLSIESRPALARRSNWSCRSTIATDRLTDLFRHKTPPT